MLYSSTSKVGHILRNYNIIEFNHDHTIYGFTCLLRNLHSDLTTVLDVNYPAYNVLYPLRTITYEEPFTPPQQYGAVIDAPLITKNNISLIAPHKARARSIFNLEYNTSLKTTTNFINDYIKTPYQQRHKTIRNSSTNEYIYSNEYLTHYVLSDVTNIQRSQGMNIVIREIVGKFYIDENDDVRLIINPKNIILSNVDKIFFSNFYMHFKNGNNYPQFFFIYTTKDDTSNIKFYYYNNIIESIVPNSKCEISLSSIFSEHWPTIAEDMTNDSLINTKFFVVQSLLNTGIFLNVNDGIVRFIPHEYNLHFLYIALNDMKLMELDYTFKYYQGSYKPSYYTNTSFYDAMNVYITTNSITPLLTTNNVIDWTLFENITNFKALLSLTSSADYFNDLIFEVAEAGDNLSIPILLVSE